MARILISRLNACPITGPVLPSPKTLSTSPFVLDAGGRLKELLDSALTGSIEAGIDYEVFTDLALLKSGFNLDDPITKYLPELASSTSPIKWKDITLRALGNHMAGIPQTYGYPDDYTLKSYFESLGFPPLSESDYPRCGVIGLHPSCTKQQLLSGLLSSVFVFPPNTRPVYSSISFTLLGYVIEEVTGKTFGEILDTEIIQPLGMENTGLQPKTKTSGVIPPVVNVWGADFQDNSPGSGLYSTTNDITRLVKGILSLSILDTPSKVRGWLKPTSETASLYSLVGMPWEITRTANLTPEHPHMIDIYAKNGHVPEYTSRMAVIGEYNVGFTILTAGLTDAINPIAEALLTVFMPAIEKATRDEATKYVGKFSTPANSTINPSITFTMDDRPGLSITEFISNSTNMLDTLATFWSLWPGSYGEPDLDLRIYPADISENVGSNETNDTSGLTREDWRLNMEPKSTAGSNGSQLPSQRVYENVCATWQGHDSFYYGSKPIDRFVFLKIGGDIVGVDIPSLHVTLRKQ
ncbi:beta-lactamase/transpeptidase-like protein [Morchella conica CCBAS932]|uniref:Beta-lactamase/transpeptidase-like protein n=1 Tax=Morchella conica CCBAS932 TaxID=1392247 RepID=A0A3N4KVB8_9PEZI|nr:beta-lactamase/transpeptidase-like protein [Morchella conica CCBAS932]